MPVLRGLTEAEALALGLPAGTSEVTSRGAKGPSGYTPGRWRQAKTYLLPPDPANPGALRHQMHIGRDVHYEDDGGNWRNIDLNWQADPTNPGEFVTDRNDIYTRVTRFGVAVWDRKRKIGLRWSTTARPNVSGRQASFPKDGLSWSWSATTHGLKLESEPILAPRGPQTYEWRYLVIDLNRLDGFNLAGMLTPDSGGNLVGDGFVTPRAYVTGANGVRYDCGPWQVVPAKTRAVAFAFDDSALPPAAFPYVIDPTTTFATAVSGDDGYVSISGKATYPPTGTPSATTANQYVFIERTNNGVANPYTVIVGLVRLDSSALPDTASVTAATLQLTMTDQRLSTDARSVTVEWYAASNWPIDAADYTDVAASTAHSGIALSSLVLNAANDFPLTTPTNVSLVGYTGFRLHISGGQPTGYNFAGFASFDHATLAEPRLIIDYTDGAAPVPLDLGTATVAGVSSITATLSTQAGPVPLDLGVATVAGTSTVSAALVTQVPLSASIAGTSSLSASPVVRLGLSAAIGAASSLSAVLVTLTPFGPAAIGAASSLAAGLGIITPLSATITGTSGLTAAIAALVAIQAQIAGLSSLTASLSVVGTLNPVALAATIAATSTVAADPIMRRGLSAQIAVDSTISATIAARLALSAQIDGLSGITANPVVLLALAAQIGAQGGIDSALAARVAMQAAITGDSATTAVLSVLGTLNPVALSAVITATSGLAAELVVLRGMTAQVTASSTVSASLAFMSEIIVLVVNVTVTMPGAVTRTVAFPGTTARTVTIPDRVEVK